MLALDLPLGWLTPGPLSAPLVVVVVVVAVGLSALVATRISRVVVRRVIRRLADHSLRSGRDALGLWRVRAGRVGDETGEQREHRRRQRIEAASRMVNHMVSLVIWIVAAIVAFHLLTVDPAFFLSSAGFLGAGLAIGGQHKVNDYLTGLSVHFEDRYGVGDEIVVNVGWEEPVQGVVDHVGLFSTRLRDGRSTLHFPNSALTNVRNLSQEAVRSTLHLHVPERSDPAAAATLLRGLAGTDGLTDVVFVGDLAVSESCTGEIDVAVRTSRTLDERSRSRLIGRAQRALADKPVS